MSSIVVPPPVAVPLKKAVSTFSSHVHSNFLKFSSVKRSLGLDAKLTSPVRGSLSWLKVLQKTSPHAPSQSSEEGKGMSANRVGEEA